jgi:putative colanic acid biosynthesis acetyltransferase WcaF
MIDPPTNKEPDSVYQCLDQCEAHPYSAREYAGRLAWEWAQRLMIRPSSRRSYRWRRFWLRRFGATIGPHSSIKSSTKILYPWLLKMDAYSILSEGVTVYNLGQVSIGEHTVVSQDVYLCAGTHDYTKPNLPLLRPSITIGRGVWICAGAFIGPGVTIGDNSVVGARAVVVKDIPSGVVVAGNPARVVKRRSMDVRLREPGK